MEAVIENVSGAVEIVREEQDRLIQRSFVDVSSLEASLKLVETALDDLRKQVPRDSTLQIVSHLESVQLSADLLSDIVNISTGEKLEGDRKQYMLEILRRVKELLVEGFLESKL